MIRTEEEASQLTLLLSFLLQATRPRALREQAVTPDEGAIAGTLLRGLGSIQHALCPLMQGLIADEEAGYRLPEEGRGSSEGGGLLIIGHHGECRECQTRGVGLQGDGEETRLRHLPCRGEE